MTDDVAYVVCELNDIPSRKARGFQLARLDETGAAKPWPIVVVRWGRQVFAYVNQCPHDGVNLDWERNQFLDPHYGIRLMCGKHGALFDLVSGTCVEGPCKGASLTPVPVSLLGEEVCVSGVDLAWDEDEDGPACDEET
jgi:nitrite reductase/ring-hydroxylating ferredoxin subunit